MASQLYADSKAPVSSLSAKMHFEKLTEKEKLYAHYFSKAAHYGTRIVLRQVSPASEQVFDLILKFYRAVTTSSPDTPIADILTAAPFSLSEDDSSYMLEYFSQFLSNLGNYKSFGDVKFIPRISSTTFAAAIAAIGDESLTTAFHVVEAAIYDTEPSASVLLGYPENGHVTGYYPLRSSGDIITKSEIEAIHDAIGGIYLPENTRVVKESTSNFVLLVASGVQQPAVVDGEKLVFAVPGISESATVTVKFGDHGREMGLIADALAKAGEYAANPTQKAMLDAYVTSFKQGSMQAHKASQRQWVKDIGPTVETNIGFIETYRDPAGIRGEWEGLIAMVNKERTKTFGALVNGAQKYIGMLPWSKEFEKDVFTPPDFTSLEVMTFAGSGIPAGINIPNYDDIRQTIGFKNVSLGNVLSAKSPNEKVPFVKESELELYEKLRGPAFEVQVGIHELLGHGSGKLLSETGPSVFNFDKSAPPVSPIDGKPVTTYYKPGQTWGSVFGTTAGSYEECRAECVAMYLATEKSLLEIFGHTETSTEAGVADDVTYIAYLLMARAGLVALEYWDPESKKWGQPHMQARFSIFKQFLEYGDRSFVKLTYADTETFDDLEIELDRSKILSHGRAAVGEYLQKLHIYKSSGDVDRGKQLYAETTTVPAELAKFRDVVLRKKMPRRQFVQCNTVLLDGGEIEYREYDETPEGMIKSFVDRDV
ncbi:peptidase family M49-domain-containing protein [Lipomyces tetrasporus]|uniref:Dipeptidyl peptidase 3 n=1 Tax=Lipomyces tetrasporus TaxID=54092 RepID=A0AAD7QZ43_9ASCO|nr:peptidase family M49-domain-containing protein [Lipomyces tetrasporus]KAJ8104069.1 peptidase family M49-domain-containing protein [Lipomyces tetrasporus]